MLALQRVWHEADYDELLSLAYHQESKTLRPIYDLVQLTQEQFGRVFRTTGEVLRIELDGRPAGFCWVQARPPVMVLHGLVVRSDLQGQGIGTQVLRELAGRYAGQALRLELIVHRSNPGARRLYERMGFTERGYDEQSGFARMGLELRGEAVFA